ncbi:MAG: hypothetical protein M3N91_00295 [Pseudomonadota bacterium]|nr:hypothetical protein [Pseudomonadota bacterium]
MSTQYFRILARAAIEPRRSALLEQLLARADASGPVSDWRADAYRIIAPQAAMPGIAPAALCADEGTADAAWVCLATPVHYVAEMTSVRLSADGILSMKPAAAATLAADFNRVWNGSGVRMMAGGSAHLYCIFDQTLSVTTRDPQDVLDRHIEEYLPTGADAPRLRQLMSELEMWLFEHEENSARAASNLPRINGLWLWGGGAPVSSLPSAQGWVAGGDVFFGAFSTAKGETSDSGVIVTPETPGGDEWYDFESRWLKPAAAGLRAGRLSRLEISAGDRCFSLTGRAIRRFWRRSKPWWESLA